jgi:hypothetical protein
MRLKLKWLALLPGVLLMALAERRVPGLTSAMFFLSMPFWGPDADRSSNSGKA